ncbi:MAG: hypothetical protein FWB93_01865 [Oscillospiraceae bacterium]|nr:hypothetical protein [Oscillospiraceae bacterium]
MKTRLTKYKVSEMVAGFIYNELEGKGPFGLSGKLTIQPEFQRNYLLACFISTTLRRIHMKCWTDSNELLL